MWGLADGTDFGADGMGIGRKEEGEAGETAVVVVGVGLVNGVGSSFGFGSVGAKGNEWDVEFFADDAG